MPTIDDHRATVAALVAPALDALRRNGLEERLVDDLVDDAGAGAGHRVLGRAVATPIDLPPFDNSQMDGFALRSTDAGVRLRVGRPIPAGVVRRSLAVGEAAPIMTGAPIPDGADVVVPVEAFGVRFPAALDLPELTAPVGLVPGTFVRTRGSDLPAGGVLAPAGAPVTPALLGVLAAAGVERAGLVRRPRVLVVSTGSELAAPEPATPSPATPTPATPGPGMPSGSASTIGDANGTSLRAALAEVGAATRAVRVPDDVDGFLGAVTDAADGWADLVLTTGGISMGAYEVVREALEPRGLVVTSVAMQPGGPQATGTVVLGDSTLPVIAFPGNPVSALVSFEVFLRPLFAAHAGMPSDRPSMTLPAADAAPSPAGKHQVRRGTVRDGRVSFVGGASSHLLAHYADATHLVHVPLGVDRVEPGDPLTVWSIR
ncbi:molybdopterin molybdotransferase MoeA [Curtobacterium sp. Leaf261]|uniref:molybdopterin molybdotransferase MoeA n=1 Tax=Curtobacterium sp. Leaf261 TaxID=1736311 RepID=UPI0006F1E1DD|nr:molybdopterin molybdotransferase MoeA [Curtobacterium sp. Leaf261]KQO62760.1 hypothetical protein ASF23_07345 [Curtobacterium sp. Leaf261]